MTREEARRGGWVLLEYDDGYVDKFNSQLKKYGLKIEEADGEFDGYQPVRVVPMKK